MHNSEQPANVFSLDAYRARRLGEVRVESSHYGFSVEGVCAANDAVSVEGANDTIVSDEFAER